MKKAFVQTESNAKHKLISGGTEDDDLFGEDGFDILNGKDGADNLFGETGNDALSGNATIPMS